MSHTTIPSRTYHLVDIENLCANGLPSQSQVRDALEAYAAAAEMAPHDHGRAAMNNTALANNIHLLPSQLRWIIAGSGPDAADDALLSDCSPEHIAAHYNHVCIGTGDHRFAGLAAELRSRGVRVTVVSRPTGLARMLAAQADDVALLPPVETIAEARDDSYAVAHAA